MEVKSVRSKESTRTKFSNDLATIRSDGKSSDSSKQKINRNRSKFLKIKENFQKAAAKQAWV